MRLIMLAVLCIAVIGCRIGTFQDIVRGEQVREGVIEEISDFDDTSVIDCWTDGRNPAAYGIITIMSAPRYAYGEEGWVAVFIKHSRTLKIANASDLVEIDISDNIELIEAVDSEFLPYVQEVPGAPRWDPRYKQNYHVPLNENYFVRIRFRYLGTKENNIAELRFNYWQRIRGNGYGDNHVVYLLNHEILPLWDQTQFYCHPTQWNTGPSILPVRTFEIGGGLYDLDDYLKHIGLSFKAYEQGFESDEAYEEWLESLESQD